MGLADFVLSCLKVAFNDNEKSQPKKRRGELGDDYDFREDFADTVDSWEAEVEDLACFADEWDGESDPKEHLERFKQQYKNTLDFLKNTVKPFLAENSDGYRKSSLNNIYKDLLEMANEHKQTFIDEEYPRLVDEYKDFLKEKAEEEAELLAEEAEWAAATKEVVEKLKACQPIKQKTFLDSFDDKSYVKAILNELVENGTIERVKKSGAYVISLSAPDKMRIALLDTLQAIKSQKNS